MSSNSRTYHLVLKLFVETQKSVAWGKKAYLRRLKNGRIQGYIVHMIMREYKDTHSDSV